MPYKDSRFKQVGFLTASLEPKMLIQFVNGVSTKTQEQLQKTLAFQFRKYKLCAHGCEVFIKHVIKFPGSNIFIFAVKFFVLF